MLTMLNLSNGYFNPRPREEGDVLVFGFVMRFFNFNPRPREEGDTFITEYNKTIAISIHALVKRATGVIYRQ